MTCNCIGGNPCPCQMGRISFGAPAMAPELRALLDMAKLHVMTPKEIYEQRISWIMGMTGKLSDPMPSRERVVKALADMGIMDPEPESRPTGDARRE